MSKSKRPVGRPAETLRIEGDWKSAVDKALGKKRPAQGWPKPAAKPAKKRKS